MNRPLRLRNVRCYCLCATNVYSTNIWYLSSYTQRLSTCTHCRGRFIVPAYYGIYGVDNRVQSMFILVHPLGYGVAFIQFGTDGSDKSAPTPTECMLRLFMYNQCLFHVYTIFVPTSRCGLSSYTNVYPRTPTVMHDCIYTIRCERARWIGPYAYGMYAADYSRIPTFTHVHPL